MSAIDEFVYIALGLFGLLVVATIIGEVLRERYSPQHENAALENFVQRIYGWWYILLVLAISLLSGPLGAVICAGLISFGAMRESLTLTAKRRADHRALVLSYYVILPVQYVLIYFNLYAVFSIFIPVYAFFLLAIVQSLRGDTTDYLARVAETQWALMVSVYAISYIPALLGLEIEGYEGRNVLLIAFLVIIVQLSDILQYLMSLWLGGRQISPRLMPSRTWPGVVSGVFAVSVLGGLFFWMTPFSMWQAFLMSMMLSLLGLFGSIVMRAVKRDRGVREWGHIIIGHGGLMDRLDSLIFSAPIFFQLVRYFWG